MAGVRLCGTALALSFLAMAAPPARAAEDAWGWSVRTDLGYYSDLFGLEASGPPGFGAKVLLDGQYGAVLPIARSTLRGHVQAQSTLFDTDSSSYQGIGGSLALDHQIVGPLHLYEGLAAGGQGVPHGAASVANATGFVGSSLVFDRAWGAFFLTASALATRATLQADSRYEQGFQAGLLAFKAPARMELAFGAARIDPYISAPASYRLTARTAIEYRIRSPVLGFEAVGAVQIGGAARTAPGNFVQVGPYLRQVF